MVTVSGSGLPDRHFIGLALLLLSMAGLAIPSHAQTWDLTNDFSGTSNPNGAWTYGQYINSAFTAFTLEETSIWQGPDWYGEGSPELQLCVAMNGASYAQYGIGPGQISLGSDAGTPVARWTADAIGIFDISVTIGGTTAAEGGGFGNVNAHQAGLNIDSVAQAGIYNSNTNVYSWLIQDVGLSARTTVDAYVNQHYSGGSTQTIFTVIQQAALAAPQLTRPGDFIIVTLKVTNVGSAAANATITAATLNGVSTTTRPLPSGTIPSGVTISVPLTFPGNAGSPGQSVPLKFSGAYGTGSYAYSMPVTLP